MYKSRWLGVILFLALLLGVVMISPESFWVDESTSASYSQVSSFPELLQKLWNDKNSEAQMPIYILFVWLWGQLVPAVEWALRASNLVWLAGTVAGAVYIGRRERTPLFPLLLILQPFLWRYVDELRPYAMQICFSIWQLAALLDLIGNRNSYWRAVVFMMASFGVCGASMLGVIPTISYAVLWVGTYVFRRTWPARNEIIAFLIGGLCITGLGGYFLKTLLSGAGGARLWSLSPGNLIFAMYELCGMVGLGPSLLSTRAAAQSGLISLVNVMLPYLPMLVLYAVVLALVSIAGGVRIRRTSSARNQVFLLIILIAGSISGMIVLALLARWPFWGRHLAPILPMYCLLLSYLVTQGGRKRWYTMAVVLYLLLISWSSVMVRFSPRHARDDYRQAAALARQYGESHRVWWVAHRTAAGFYDVPLKEDPLLNTGVFKIDPSSDFENIPLPALILINRPEATDSSGIVRDLMHRHNYQEGLDQITGFSVWYQR